MSKDSPAAYIAAINDINAPKEAKAAMVMTSAMLDNAKLLLEYNGMVEYTAADAIALAGIIMKEARRTPNA